jgi:molecular chaperone DnaK (HSP70)
MAAETSPAAEAEAEAAATNMVVNVVVVGVDVGAESSKVVLGSEGSCEIVRNDVGGHTTPTIISLGENDKQPRQLGTKVPKNAVYHLNRLMDGEISSSSSSNDDNDEDEDLLQTYYPFTVTSEGVVENVTYHGESSNAFSNSALLGMLLGKVKENVTTTWRRQNSSSNAAAAVTMPALSMALACPPDMTEAAQQQVVDAAYAAGIDTIQLVDRSTAYQTSYTRKFPEHAGRKVMIVDVGHADTTVSILGPSGEAQEENGEAATDDDDAVAVAVEPTMKVLACERHKGLGAGVVDVRLWQHFQSTHKSLGSVTPKSRGGQRLLAGMTKLKHLLSQLPEAKVTVENVGQNDTDVSLEAKRSLLVELCSKEVQAMTALVQQALTTAGIDSPSTELYSVEVVGGGCRMPWVKEVLEKATQMSTLSYTLDDTSAALGAALIGEQSLTDPTTTATTDGIMTRRSSDETPTQVQVVLRETEAKMEAQDQELHLRSATLNQIESHILGLRSAQHETHGDLLPAELFSHLDTVEDWLFSPEADDIGYEALQAKWQETEAKTSELSKEYTLAIDTERKTKEAEMEAEAKQAQKERDGEEAANNGDEEDHDNRRLPKKRRMEIVLKNKKEGGELFSDGNFKFAAARYAKALSHCAKFVDLAPDDLEEVKGVKLTLNLNLALAYVKLQNPDQALRYSNDALTLDDNHVKALYRRASIYYEKKNWTAASQDLQKAMISEPEDKALQKLQEKVDAQMKRQKLNEKKMAQKMFG